MGARMFFHAAKHSYPGLKLDGALVLLFNGPFDRMKGIGISMTLTPLEMGGQPMLAICMGINRHIL